MKPISDEDKIAHYKAMEAVEDLSLTREEKLRLIANIPIRQQERRERLRFFHNCEHIGIKARHALMSMVIKTIREQQARLEKLKKFL